ncbi:hypothetical protein ACVWZM_004121 [Bradyrhizobium sp. USDA 4501]
MVVEVNDVEKLREYLRVCSVPGSITPTTSIRSSSPSPER